MNSKKFFTKFYLDKEKDIIVKLFKSEIDKPVFVIADIFSNKIFKAFKLL